jgi:SAM-dependent methyltransferase
VTQDPPAVRARTLMKLGLKSEPMFSTVFAQRYRFERPPACPRLRWLALFCCIAVSACTAWAAVASYAGVKPVLDQTGQQLPAELKNPTDARWRAWSRGEDKSIRARLRQGELDSMVNLLLYGTSFTKQPRIRIESLAEASKSGALRARVEDLVMALRNPGDNERLSFLNALLHSAGVNPGEPGPTGVFIYNNLQRVIQETAALAKRGEEARRLTRADGAPDSAAIFKWRSGLLRDRGVSLDTGIFPDYAIEQALRDLKNRGVLREGQVARVAVIGPGLDFSDKNEAFSYDYYPQQTTQPFALYDSLLRLRLAGANGVSMTIFDISARVIGHIQRAREAAKRNVGYNIQMPREVGNPWPADLVRYWRSLGDQVGKEVMPIPPPEIFRTANDGQGLEARAVQVRPDVVLRCHPVDLNIVLDRIHMPEAERFDLIVGTNIFIYYDAFERSLALENAGAMLKGGGLLLTNDWLPEVRGGAMRQIGLTDTPFTHDAVGWYRKE